MTPKPEFDPGKFMNAVFTLLLVFGTPTWFIVGTILLGWPLLVVAAWWIIGVTLGTPFVVLFQIGQRRDPVTPGTVAITFVFAAVQIIIIAGLLRALP